MFFGGQFISLAAGDPGLLDFIDLDDVPGSFAGAGGQVVKVNAGATALEFVEDPPGGGLAAPAGAQYVVLVSSSALSAERVLTGTAFQVIVTDGSGKATLSTPQNIHAAATPTFSRLTLTQATGSSALVVSSTTIITNLNADLLDGFHEASFALLAGRAGGQTFVAGTAAGDDLILRATANATGGDTIFQSDPTTERGRLLSTGELCWNVTAASGTRQELVHARKDQDSFFTGFLARNMAAGTAAEALMIVEAEGGYGVFGHTSIGYTNNPPIPGDATYLFASSFSAGGLALGTNGATPIIFVTNTSDRGRILSGGGWCIGASALISAEKLLVRHSDEDEPLAVWDGNNGSTNNVSGAITDGYNAAHRFAPEYRASSAQTVDRHNMIDFLDPVLSNVTLTDATLVRFNAAAGTHKAVDAASTKTTPTAVDGWVKINVNGTIHYIPAYLSKTA